MIHFSRSIDPVRMKAFRRRLRKQQTPSEELIWNRLRDNQLGIRIQRQYSVGPYILDFYVRKYRIGIEIDGEIHDRPDRIEYDRIRERQLEALGIQMLHFKRQYSLNHPEKVVQKIWDTIIKKPPSLPSLSCQGEG